ncbi:hypothetical protein Gohar_024664 [Gossypium harknessii]|uniref:Uncharacterized protein n=1 Tax=Gossypium harknessii TaxID=34285 RepID=A0A7J9HGL0_9ROSI|nr:hypothetical protein [Gossypium harknessii]
MGIAEKPIDFHTHYMFPFNKNAENFLEKERALINSQIRLQGDVEKAKTKNQKIKEVVEDRYWLCKEMYEKTLAITQLIETLKFDRVGHHVALPRLEFFLTMGMGDKRSGQDNLFHAASNKIKESQLFDDVAMAIVSETLDVGEIQYTIADSLGITFERRTREGKAMFSLDLMDEEEVWNLFKLYAGLDNASLDIVEVVMKVAKK